jgi:hypothetical protein
MVKCSENFEVLRQTAGINPAAHRYANRGAHRGLSHFAVLLTATEPANDPAGIDCL